MATNRKFVAASLILCSSLLQVESFLQTGPFSHRLKPGHEEKTLETTAGHRARHTSALMGKLWDRMEIEEDPEPFWYVLNCVAGLEIDLLRQCRQTCEDMEDVEKFVVPMVTNTRSHGANRMVQDTKVKYQGYVFAKLRLCPATYEAIQGLDLCRSWMGTINQFGHKKLPPAPVALNEVEIENFGLEDLESEEPEEEEEDENVILDTEEEDQAAAAMEEHVQTVYKGLRVGDMIKVTAKNKFQNEDGIVRRLKDKKIFIRFYTYGSMFEEWLDPTDVRKLDDIEVLKGLQGPNQPITQRDIDGPQQRERPRYDDGRPREMRRNLAGQFGSGPRNRRQDRNANRFSRDDSPRDRRREEENWDWYKANERNKQGNKAFSDADSDYEFRGSSNNRRERQNDWAERDVNSQWGRPSQRQNRRDRNQRRERQNNNNNSDEDWSAFVSSGPAPSPSEAETDDFFASLMTDLSNDLNNDNGEKPSSNSGRQDSASSDEDDFFASLMSEISDDEGKGSKQAPIAPGSDDDFFESLSQELQDDGKKTSSKASSASDELDDFFAEFAAGDDGEVAKSSKSRGSSGGGADEGDLEDFFQGLAVEADTGGSGGGDDEGDFFAGLEAELESELNMTPQEPESEPEPVKEAPKATQKPKKVAPAVSTSAGSVDLQKCTVPVLKDMLRERGLKVSGKKAELIERLSA